MIRIIVHVSGGLVQSVIADGPCKVLIMDYDTDGQDSEGYSVARDTEGKPYNSEHVSFNGQPKVDLALKVDEIFRQDALYWGS